MAGKFAMLLKVASCGCAVAIIVLGVIHLLMLSLDIPSFVRNVYFVIFGLLLIIAEFSHISQVQFLLKYLSLLTTYMGDHPTPLHQTMRCTHSVPSAV